MALPASSEVLRFSIGPFSCELDAASIKLGRIVVRYEDITGLGVGVMDPSVGVGGVRVRKVGTHKQFLFFLAYRSGGNRRHVAVIVGDDRGISPDGGALVSALRSRAPDRWIGEGSHLEIRKRLGISNAPIVIAVVAAIAAALLITAGIVTHAVQSAHSTHSPRTAPAQRR